MKFEAIAACKWCGQSIMPVDGLWVDYTITHPVVTSDFASMCGEGAPTHEPETLMTPGER